MGQQIQVQKKASRRVGDSQGSEAFLQARGFGRSDGSSGGHLQLGNNQPRGNIRIRGLIQPKKVISRPIYGKEKTVSPNKPTGQLQTSGLKITNLNDGVPGIQCEPDGRTRYTLHEYKHKIAQDAINYARIHIRYGPDNQCWGTPTKDRHVRMGATVDVGNDTFKYFGGWNETVRRPKRLAAIARNTGGGNCQEYAALVYNYLRDRALPEWKICYVNAPEVPHWFATIGDPKRDQALEVVVADAWLKDGKPVSLSNHFCVHERLNIDRCKGRKKGRLSNLENPNHKYNPNIDLASKIHLPKGYDLWNKRWGNRLPVMDQYDV